MRFDMATLRGVRVHPAGFLLVDARPTRTGIFRYRRPDGSVRAEYRPPDEVSRLDSLTTLRGASVTDLHPAAGRISPDNVQALEVGTVTDARMDGAHVVAELVVKRKDAIEAVKTRARVELSCGYQCDYDDTPGTTPEGERYDGVQRNIRYNHVALLPKGTARGGPECRLRLDAKDAVLEAGLMDGGPHGESHDEAPLPDLSDGERADATKNGDPMAKIVIGGVSFEAPEQTAQAVTQALTEQKTKVDGLVSELDKTKARADSLKDELDKEKKLRADAADPAKIRAAVEARVQLERSATKVLGDEVKLDGLTDREIAEKVILHAHKDAQLSGKSDDYVHARFDSVIESHQPEDKRSGLDEARRKIDPAPDKDRKDDKKTGDDGMRTDADFRKRLHKAWQEPLSTRA